MSPYALLTGAILLMLASPLIWMACKVARDHVVAGAAFTAGLVGLMIALHAHLGTRLVDITFGVVGVATVAMFLTTVAGRCVRRHGQVREANAALPSARVHRR